jgi:hypothetical protein
VQYLHKSTPCRVLYGGYGHVYVSLTSCSDGPLGSTQIFYESTSAATLDGRTRQWSHFFQQNRSVRLVYTQFVGWARMKSYLDYILSRCTQGSFIFATNTADSRRRPHLLPTSLIRPSGSYITCGARSHEERVRLHPESMHSG